MEDQVTFITRKIMNKMSNNLHHKDLSWIMNKVKVNQAM